jgi:ribonuclease HI
MKKIVIFASGGGTNAENMIKYFEKKESATVVSVFTNNSNAKVIERASDLKVSSEIFSKNELFEGKVLEKLNIIHPDLIILAGFLLKLPESIIENYPNKIINIHPALLPKYGGKGMYGMNVHKAVVENQEKESGITIHYVNENYDEGNIIFQKSFPLSGNETPDDVAEKIHELEQRHFPEVIEKIITQDLNKKLVTLKHDVHIYTDGAAKGNPGRGGYGVVMELVGTPHKKEFYEGFRLTTNNRMELLAVIVGLEKLKNPNMKVLVVSDSKYVVDSVVKKWVLGWEKKGFADRKNSDLWKRFLVIYRKHQVDFKWIKGHNNHPQNERCDELAVMASMQKDVSIDVFYEKEVDKLL